MGPYTRIAIRLPNGRTEIIGRHGHQDPHIITRSMSGVGKVLSVRHEVMSGAGEHPWVNGRHTPPSGNPVTVQITRI